MIQSWYDVQRHRMQTESNIQVRNNMWETGIQISLSHDQATTQTQPYLFPSGLNPSRNNVVPRRAIVKMAEVDHIV